MPTLHIVIPTFNEGPTIEPCLRRVVTTPLPDGWDRALYVIDDHSSPPNDQIVRDVVGKMQAETHRLSLTRHDSNLGKGGALATGFQKILSTNPHDDDIIIIQDADLEYDPGDYASLMTPIFEGDTNVVIGARWGDHHKPASLKRRIHSAGNGVLTRLSNLMTGYRVSDMECCYKLMTIKVLKDVAPQLTESRFGIEPQIIAILSRLGEPIIERPVRYDPRGIGAGKKIGWRDGVRAIHVILHEKLRAS